MSTTKGTAAGRWRRRLRPASLLALATTLVVVTGCGSSGAGSSGDGSSGASGATAIKVGYVYLGPPGDAGWTYQHDQGRKYVEQHVPGAQSIVLQSVPESNAGPALEQLVAKGCKIIFATSFGYGPAVMKVARAHPDVDFEHATGINRAPNVSTYFAKHWEGSYLLGMLAAYSTKSNVLGYVGSFPIGEVIGDINAYTLGAQSVKPDIKVKTVLVNNWFNPPQEKQAAKSLIDAGADSLMSIEDSPSVLQQAGLADKTASVSYSNMRRFAPNAFLSGNVYNWGPYYVSRVKAAMNGTWRSEDFWGSLRDGTLSLAPFGTSVSPAARRAVQAKLRGFKDGSFNPFKGPIEDQGGAVRVPRGQAMTQSQLVNWTWYVRGVEGKAK
jgi:basic membrane protein A